MSKSDLATSDQVKILELKVKIRERKITFLEKALAKGGHSDSHQSKKYASRTHNTEITLLYASRTHNSACRTHTHLAPHSPIL